MSKLILDSSLFEPLEVDIQGVTHRITVDMETSGQVDALVDEDREKKISVSEFNYRMLGIYLKDHDLAKTLPYAAVLQINAYIRENTIDKINQKPDAEKNAPGPGPAA